MHAHTHTCTHTHTHARTHQVWTGLLVVDTSPAKATLAARAEWLVEALLGQLLDKSIQVRGV